MWDRRWREARTAVLLPTHRAIKLRDVWAPLVIPMFVEKTPGLKAASFITFCQGVEQAAEKGELFADIGG